MNSPIPSIQKVQEELEKLSLEKSFSQAQRVMFSVIALLDPTVADKDPESVFQLFTDSDGKIRANAGWFFEDKMIADRKAVYKIHGENALGIDFKAYGVSKASKRIVSWATGVTPNFEDEAFNGKFNVGIDFVVPKSCDRVIVVLTNNYVVRTLELKGKLTATYQEILAKWASINDFSNKKAFHSILWESFDLQPLNKKFYAGISERFILLRQHLEKEGIFDQKHASYFSNRLMGRVIFCWFLDHKNVLNAEKKYFDAKAYPSSTDYYRGRLETLFYRVLNTPVGDREPMVQDDVTPFLNGGLFEPRATDLFENPKLTFPKNYFDDLFEFLSGYNFTTDESTSQFQQVAIDPEMLGRIFENLLAEMTEETGEQARKAKGAFYTPREIVDYMCRESLREYLKTKIAEDEFRDKRLEQLIDRPDKEFQDQDHNWRRDWKPYKDAIIKALDELTVLDPACGSGAFPIGMLQLLVQVYERLESRFDSYRTKLRIIEKNLYGVDIEPMAVEIARLRAWLSIIVDEDADSKKIKPLPNLEFKFICANSLIDLDQNSETPLGGKDHNALAEELRTIRDAYFNTESLNKKKSLREKYNKLINEQEGLFGESKRSKQLKTYRPFDNEWSAGFFNPEFMFGAEKLFDVVIGNPPYVQIQKFARTEMQSDLEKAGYGTFAKMGDIYALFYERGLELTKKSTGLLCFITSNKWMRAGYGEKLRDYFARKNPLFLLDFGGFKVFESATVDTNILLIGNGENRNALQACHFQNDYRRGESLKGYCESRFVELQNLSSDTWFIGSAEELALKAKIERVGKPLKEWDVKINYGIKTGLNEAFIIDQAKRDELVAKDPKSAEILRPILRGRDIKRYGYDWAGLYAIATFPALHIDIDDFPAVKEYLINFGKDRLEQSGKRLSNGTIARKKTGNKWFETQDQISYYKEFEKEKIVWPDIMREPRGNSEKNREFPYLCLDRSGTYQEATNFIMTGSNLSLIIAVLNSKAGVYFFVNWFAGPKFDNKGFRYKKMYLENFLVPVVTPENKNIVDRVIADVDQILTIKKTNSKADTSVEEKEIDQLVYQLYGLTEEEIKIIEG